MKTFIKQWPLSNFDFFQDSLNSVITISILINLWQLFVAACPVSQASWYISSHVMVVSKRRNVSHRIPLKTARAKGISTKEKKKKKIWENIVIMSHHQHGYPWPFLATFLYRPLLLARLQGYIQYLHRAAVCRF